MPITKFSTGPSRNQVGFLGTASLDKLSEELQSRGFSCYTIDYDKPDEFSQFELTHCAVIPPDKSVNVYKYLEKYGATFLNHGCNIYLLPAQIDQGKKSPFIRKTIISHLNELRLPPSGLSESDKQYIGDWLEEPYPDSLGPFVHVTANPNHWLDIANTITYNLSGRASNQDLSIHVANCNNQEISLYRIAEDYVRNNTKENNLTVDQISKEYELLIRRAFHDCSEIILTQVHNGLSGVPTFRGYATRFGSTTGAKHPYQHFVKLGKRKSIATEYIKYQYHALQYIPFHLGPRLEKDRCELGHSQGILVCDYVHGAEPLKNCAKDERATAAISNLFNITILPWHRNSTLNECSLMCELDVVLPKSIPDHRKSRIEKLGSTLLPSDLRALIDDGVENILFGVVHGDLHATNILVRSNDAIIIDFEKVKESFPLLFDVASLEAGLFVDGFIGDIRTTEHLLESIRCLYVKDAFNEPPPACQAGDGSEWFFNCVRQIRMHARELELSSFQYAKTLAIVLIKKGCGDINFVERFGKGEGSRREDLRALAYVLGERLLISITS